MQIQIIGSGGFLPTPRFACNCRICSEARKKGAPYQRRGPSVYFKDISALFDTPEDVNESLNFSGAKKIENIFYTHWHPDHTLGYRIVEVLMDQDFFKTKKQKKIVVYVPDYDYDNIKKAISGLWYFESRGYVEIRKITESGIKIKNTSIKLIKLGDTSFSAYLIEQAKKKILLCPDHAMHLPAKKEFVGVDLLVMNLGFFENNLRGAKALPRDPRLLNSTGFIKDNLRIIESIKPRKTILMHIEEKFNRSNKELSDLEKKHKKSNIKFAVDGLNIKI
mgnify:CR=1 FL=1